MSSGKFSRICRDLSQFGESITFACTKEGIKFSASGDYGSGKFSYTFYKWGNDIEYTFYILYTYICLVNYSCSSHFLQPSLLALYTTTDENLLNNLVSNKEYIFETFAFCSFEQRSCLVCTFFCLHLLLIKTYAACDNQIQILCRICWIHLYIQIFI